MKPKLSPSSLDSARPRLASLSARSLVLAMFLLIALASSAQATVLWSGDAEEPASREWASSAAAGAACAVNPPDMTTPELSVSPSPLPAIGPPAAHPNAYHFRVSEGDDCYGPRSELGQANPENPQLGDRKFYPGQDRWVAFEAYLPDDYQLNLGNGYNSGLMQLKQIGAHGYPALNVISGSGYLCLYIDSLANQPENRHCGPGAFDLGQPAKDAWIRLAIHVYFSGDEAGEAPGFVEVYGDLQDGRGYGLLLPRIYARTSKLNEEVPGEPPLPTQARIGLYRNPLIKGTEDLYVGGFTAATDQQSAEEGAFTDSGPRVQPTGSLGQQIPEEGGSADSPAHAHTTGSEPSSPAVPQPSVRASTTAPPPASVRLPTHIWLRARRLGMEAARGVSQPAWRLSGGVASGAGARRRVAIDLWRDGRWRRVATTQIARGGRFSLKARLPLGRGVLRASVAGVGSSRRLVVES